MTAHDHDADRFPPTEYRLGDIPERYPDDDDIDEANDEDDEFKDDDDEDDENDEEDEDLEVE